MLTFFKNPIFLQTENNSWKLNFQELFKILLYAYLFFFFNYLLVSAIDFSINYSFKFSFLKLLDRLQSSTSGDISILFILVILPFIEEITFRLPLKIKRINFFISAIGVYFLFINPIYLIHKLPTVLELTRFLIFLIVAFCVCFYLVQNKFLKLLAEQYFPYYFYFISIMFGLLHVTNFIDEVPINLVLFAPIFTFHQVIGGFFLGYMRIKTGLFWCFLLHVLFNLPPAIYYFSQ